MRAVCLHGAGGGGWQWRKWQRVLATNGIETTAPDLPGAGAPLDERLCAARLACEGADLVIGASLGGYLAQRLTLRPAALRVLINALPAVGGRAPPASRSLGRWRFPGDLAGALLAMPDVSADDARFAAAHWRDDWLDLADLPSASPTAARTIVIAGESDRHVPAADSRRLAAVLDAEFWLVDGAAHLGPVFGEYAVAQAQRIAWICRR